VREPEEQAPVVDRLVRLDFEVDPVLTLGPLRHGPDDPTIRFEAGVVWRATRTAAGPATLRLAPARGGLRAMAWGPGAEPATECLPRLLGSEDDPSRLVVESGRLADLVRRLRGLRFGRSDAVMESLVPAIIEQKVTGPAAQRAYRGLVRRFGQPAPGPGGLWLAPEPARLARLPYYEMHPLGIEQRRAVTLIRAAERAAWLEEGSALPTDAATTRLQAIPGVGPWTAAETARSAWGDPDAVSLGDFHTPDLVAWMLAGEPRGDDGRMLELLEPYRGQRARLVRILELSGVTPPRRGPRVGSRPIADL
jgi:3-methyladenine DNA glycosylase/8-oxoguanine DNA glycosylase